MKKILILITFFAITNLLKANDSCKIWFENLDSDPYFAKIYKSNENYYQSSTYKDYLDCKVEKKRNISFLIKTPQLIGIKINDFVYFVIAVVPRDEITISVHKNLYEKYPKYYINFWGSNAKAHTKYYNEYYPIAKKFNGIDKAEKDYDTYKGYYIETRMYVDSLVNNFVSECTEENHSNKQVVRLYTLDFKASLMDYAKRRLGNVKVKDTLDKWNKYFQWRNFRELFYFYGEANNQELLKCFTGRYLYNNYLTDIVRNDSLINDSVLKKNDLCYFYLYPQEIKEEAWAEELLDLVKFFPSKNYNEYINLFAKNFPNSPYLIPILNFRDSILNERENLRGSVSIIENKTNTLKDFFKPYKERYFFIDCWATWCTPCIQEFNFYTEISNFLFQNNVQQVFFSIDKLSDSLKVYDYVNKQKIKGYHTIINKILVNEIIKELKKDINSNIYDTDNSFTIPRYLLYDKVKGKLYVNLPKPSSGNLLKEAIRNILEK